jgi:aspartyl/asparaginyl beta-hydroxylase (cupin superfamily)
VVPENYHWDPDLYFDDTFPQSVENKSDKFRVILLLDTVRDLENLELNIITAKLIKKVQDSELVQSDIKQANLLHALK